MRAFLALSAPPLLSGCSISGCTFAWPVGLGTPHPSPDCVHAAGGGGLDLRSLAIIPGKAVWLLYVDALVLNDGGGVLGALSAAAVAALSDTRLPNVSVTMGSGAGEVRGAAQPTMGLCNGIHGGTVSHVAAPGAVPVHREPPVLRTDRHLCGPDRACPALALCICMRCTLRLCFLSASLRAARRSSTRPHMNSNQVWLREPCCAFA